MNELNTEIKSFIAISDNHILNEYDLRIHVDY